MEANSSIYYNVSQFDFSHNFFWSENKKGFQLAYVLCFPQNAWTGGYIAGTSIGTLAASSNLEREACLQLEAA
jgi:hypothetical protein